MLKKPWPLKQEDVLFQTNLVSEEPATSRLSDADDSDSFPPLVRRLGPETILSVTIQSKLIFTQIIHENVRKILSQLKCQAYLS